MEKIYTLLKDEYNLKTSHILILKELQKGKKLSAKDLVYTTKIPIGSIYEFLRDLENINLIQTINENPTKYQIDDFEKNMIKFIDSEFENNLRKREKILTHLKESKRDENFQAFSNYSDFKLTCIKITPTPKILYGELKNYKFPIFFFPNEKELHAKYKMAISKHLCKISNITNPNNINLADQYKKTLNTTQEIKWLISQTELTNFFKIIEKEFGKTELKKLKQQIKEYLKQPHIEVKVTTQNIDYRYYLTENSFQPMLMFEPTFIGMVISDEKVINTFHQTFLNKFKQSKDLIKYL